MKTFLLHYECILDASLDAVCTFHTDTRNLSRITPPWINVMIMSMDVPMREGSVVELQIKRYGIPTTWKMKIAKLSCPTSVIDEMISGPFRFFRHERKFIPIDNEHTKMEETITLSLNFPLISNLFFPLIKKDMDAMFTFRHQATQSYFQEI